jgi:hypothetical protein
VGVVFTETVAVRKLRSKARSSGVHRDEGAEWRMLRSFYASDLRTSVDH